MSIGEDIKSVIQELGTPITILQRDGSTVTGEYIDYDNYYEQSTEFIRQFCYSGDFQYDSVAIPGDIIQFSTQNLMLMNKKHTRFENDVVDSSCFLIECNNFGKFLRSVNTRNVTTKKLTAAWSTIVKDSLYGLLISRKAENEEIGGLSNIIEKYTLFVPAGTTILPGDRWFPSRTVLTEYYEVLTVDTYRFDGILTIGLIEDSR